MTAKYRSDIETTGNITAKGKLSAESISSPSLVGMQQFSSDGSSLRNLASQIHPAENLLKQAVWWIDSAHSSANSQNVTNLGWGGSILNTQCGSSSSADSNDPLFLDWTGENYVYLPGVASNYLSVPDENALDITGDIDIRVRVALDDWTPAATQMLLAKFNNTGDQRSYHLTVRTSGVLRLTWSADGVSSLTADSTAAPTVTDGAPLWVRAALDTDDGGVYKVFFYTSTDGASWSQLGATVTGGSTTSVFASTSGLRVGQDFGTTVASGSVYRAQIFNGIDGTPVLDIDCSAVASGAATSFTARTGQTVTINRSTSGKKSTVVTNPLWLFGGDDYMEVTPRWLEHTGTNYVYLPGVAGNSMSTPDAAALDITGDIDIRARIALDDWTPSVQTYIISKWGGSGQSSYTLSVNTIGTLILQWSANGTAFSTVQSNAAMGLTDGAAKWVRVTLDVDNGASGHNVMFYTSDDGSTWTQLGTTITTAGTTSVFSGTSQLWVGSLDGINGPLPGKVFRAQVYNGIGGTLVFDADTSVITGNVNSFTASTGQTVTINRSGTTYQSYGVTQSGYLSAGNPNVFTPHSYSLLDFGTSDSFTVLWFGRDWLSTGWHSWYVSKAYTPTADTLGWGLWKWNGTDRLYADTRDSTGIQSDLSTYPLIAGQASLYGMIVNKTAGTVVASVNGEGVSSALTRTNTSFANVRQPRIGCAPPGATGGADYEFHAAAVFRRTLTPEEIKIILDYYKGRVA